MLMIFDIMTGYSANDTIAITVMHQDGQVETLNVTLSDKYDYYLELGWSKSNLDDLGIEQGDPFQVLKGCLVERQESIVLQVHYPLAGMETSYRNR